MDITKYIPNIFGQSVPSYLPGLLGEEETKNLQNRANVQGLLGAGLALAQGMSNIGPRRSAAENILGAIAGGFGAAGGAYEQGVKNYMTQQQLAQAQLERQQVMAKQASIDRLLQIPEIANDPLKVAYIRANTNEALKLYSELLPLQEIGRTLSQQQATPSQTTAISSIPQDQVPTGQADFVSATTNAAGEKTFPPVLAKTTDPLASKLVEKQKLERIISAYGDPKVAGNEKASKTVDTALKRLAVINNEITKLSVSDLSRDLEQLKASAPEQFRPQIENLMSIAATGELTPDQYAQRVSAIQEKIYDFNKNELDFKRKQLDFTNEARRIAKKEFNKNIEDLSKEENAKLDEIMFGKEKELRKSGRSLQQVNVGDKVLAGERAKSQSRAEESAINAQNAASDVAAIIEILKPYRGGALQDFAGTIGAYLPGTKLEQLATAKQAAEAIRAKLAPTLRVEGSGATSDFEIKSFLSAIPSLFNTTEGRDLMATYAQRLADRAVAAADIRAKLVEENRYSIKNFQEELRKQGLDRVFTANDIQKLRGKSPGTESTLPADVRQKYGL